MIIRPSYKEEFRRTRGKGIGLVKASDGKDQMCPESAEAWVAMGEDPWRGPREKAYAGEAEGARLNEESEGSEGRLQKA